MRISGSKLCALFVCCAIIEACSQTTELPRLQNPSRANGPLDGGAGPLHYRVLHSFGADHDGDYPLGSLMDGGDKFYGTTEYGGSHDWGTVFSITTSGAEETLHSFNGGFNGSQPYAGVTDVSGTLYGTTPFGGAFGDGTVFSMTRAGSEKVLHSFGKGTDGKYPSAVLTDVGGTLYGTTGGGGTNNCDPSEGCGTVFSITRAGRERVLHSFGRGDDGRFPFTGLIDVGGKLYGTTAYGGEYGTGKYGTVFSITRNGKEEVLHSFGEAPDGALPESDLVYANGKIYGTTWYGGAQNFGTIFDITPGGLEKVLHNFGGADGSEPYGGLIYVGGRFYGTTIGGGKYRTASGFGGTLFSITPSGAEKVLHSFGNGTDGAGPLGDLTYKNGRLFGVTESGGTYASPQITGGTVFSFAP